MRLENWQQICKAEKLPDKIIVVNVVNFIHIDITKKEKVILDLLKDHNHDYYIIAVHEKEDKSIFYHELAHALFYTEEKDKKNGEYLGHIDEVSLKNLVKDVSEREVYLCGPEGFMYALRDTLVVCGVNPKKIHFEVFSFHS